MYIYGWLTSLYSRNQHNNVKQLYSNTDVKKKRNNINSKKKEKKRSWCSTLSTRQRILNMKLLTCFHKVFWVTFICSGSKFPRQHWHEPSSLSKIPGTLQHLVFVYQLWSLPGMRTQKTIILWDDKFLELVWEILYKTHFLKRFCNFFCNSNYSRNQHALSGIKTKKFLSSTSSWASLVAQWLRICLPMQGTRVRALV